MLNTIRRKSLYLDNHLGINLLGNEKPISTKELIISLREENGLKPNLIPIPKALMKFCLSAIGKKKVYEQLYKDLVFISSIEKKYYNDI